METEKKGFLLQCSQSEKVITALGLRESRKVHFFLKDKGILSMFLGIFLFWHCVMMFVFLLPREYKLHSLGRNSAMAEARDVSNREVPLSTGVDMEAWRTQQLT